MHTYLAQHCFFLPLPHMPVEIRNVTATSKKTKDPGLHEGKYRFTNSGLRFTPNMDWQLWFWGWVGELDSGWWGRLCECATEIRRGRGEILSVWCFLFIIIFVFSRCLWFLIMYFCVCSFTVICVSVAHYYCTQRRRGAGIIIKIVVDLH